MPLAMVKPADNYFEKMFNLNSKITKMKYVSLVCMFFISITAASQDCKNYLFLQNNKTIEMTIYNKKGDVAGRQVYTVSDYKNSGGIASATVNTEMFDKKGKSIVKSVNNVQCKGGVMMMDMKMNIPQGQQFSNTEAKAENVYIEYPSTMSVGETLKDGHMQLETDSKGMKQTLTMDITNRKVEGKESVTTSAGTWECYKITSSSKMKITTMGIGIPINTEVTEWYAPGVGVIKTESKAGGTAITAIN